MSKDHHNFSVRPAKPSDLPEIHAIQAYYVCNTAINFCYQPVSLEEIQKDYDDVLANGYPYFVASSAITSSRKEEQQSVSELGSVWGYAYVHHFRGRSAYQYTGELSIFCDPKHTGIGIGRALLQAIILSLKGSSLQAKQMRAEPRTNRVAMGEELDRKPGKDIDERVEGRPRDICQLMACMTVVPDKEKDERLKLFYQKFGFVETVMLRKVGWKFGQWYDTRYMQLGLQ